MFEPKDKAFDKDSLKTPRYIFDWLDSIYHFDVDICASEEHYYCENYYTKKDSALLYQLARFYKCGWNNPPYSKIDPWIEKAINCAKAGMTTVMLIPDFNGESRFDLIPKYATNITHLTPRVSFVRPDNGELYKGNNRGSCIIEFSPSYIKNPPIHHYVNLKEIEKKFGDKL